MGQSASVRRLTIGLTVAAVFVLAGACVSVPKVKPDHVGLGLLPLQPQLQDVPPYSDATNLPKLPGSGAGEGRLPYGVGPLDTLVIKVWGRDDLGSQVPIGQGGELRGSIVREDGTIFMPFLGSLKVEGRSTEEIRGMIESRYAKLIENPQVEVELHDCASKAVQVGGAVSRPGRYYLCNDVLTVGEVLTAAQGPAGDADLVRGVLTRDGQPYHLNYSEASTGLSRASQILLEEGDHVYFPNDEQRVVYVFGHVRRQGIFTIPSEGMTLLGALGQAKGVDMLSAKHRGIFLIRDEDTGIVTYKLNLEQLLEGPEIALANGDRLYVMSKPLERWDRWWRKALPFTTVRTNVEIIPEE